MFSAKKLKENPVDKLRQQQEETARVYAEFVKSFDIRGNENDAKTFVRGGVVSKSGDSLVTSSTGKPSIYKPQKKGLWLPPPSSASSVPSPPSSSSVFSLPSVFSSANSSSSSSIPSSSAVQSSSYSSQNAKTAPKSKTKEIDAFLEEIKRRQMLQDEKKKLTKSLEEAVNEEEKEIIRKRLASLESMTKLSGISLPPLPSPPPSSSFLSSSSMSSQVHYDNAEPECSTNLYIGNLSPEVTEEYLCQQFGKFGAITSVKIMYPRTEEEKMRKRNCGFVSFHTRAQAEAAKNALDSSDFYGMTVRIGWGKAIPKPSTTPTPPPLPIVPATSMPLPAVSTGAQSKGGFSDAPPALPEAKKVEVKVPKSKKTKILIDTLAKYVAEEGHPFEQCIMEKESPTGRFRFLFEHDSEDNIYYRWLVYAYAQGDTTLAWRTESFFIYTGGSQWVPPAEEHFLQPRSRVAAETAAEAAAAASLNREKMRLMQQGKQKLTTDEKEALRNILRSLDYTRESICAGMTYCLDHAYCAMHIAEFLFLNISDDKNLLPDSQSIDSKVTCLYLLSDILYNSSSLQPSAWAYRTAFEIYLPEIFNYLNTYVKNLGKLSSRILKEKVLKVLRVWEDWAIYAPQFIQGLEATFLKTEKRLKLFLSDYDDSDIASMQENNLDESLDGEVLKEFDELIKLPVWLRPIVYEWMKADDSKVERICKDRGIIWTKISERKQLVMQNLINFELFWNQNALRANMARLNYWADNVSDDEEEKARIKALNVAEDENLNSNRNDNQVIHTVCNDNLKEETEKYDNDTNIFSNPYNVHTKNMFCGDNNSGGNDSNNDIFTNVHDDSTNITYIQGINNEDTDEIETDKYKEEKEEDIHSESSDDIFAERDEEEEENDEFKNKQNGSFAGRETTGGGEEEEDEKKTDEEKEKEKLQSISRIKLRQVELEVMQLQVNLEKTGMDSNAIQLKCDMKRQQLIQNCEKELKQEYLNSLNADSKKSESPEENKKKRRRNNDSEETGGSSKASRSKSKK